MRTWLSLFILVTLFTPYGASAEGRLACDMKRQKIIQQAQKSNMCHDDSDCSYVDIKDCTLGCATLPIYKHMESRLELALRDYNASCLDGCKVGCEVYLQGKCLNGKCTSEYRDWKYLTKKKK